MKGDIATFLEDVKLGKVSNRNVFEAVSRFEEAIESQLEHLQPLSDREQFSQHHGAENFHGNAFRSAVNSFVTLTLRTIMKELSAYVFLTTEFTYDNTSCGAPDSAEIAIAAGLESLMHIHARSPMLESLQRWSHIAIAANFLHEQPLDRLEWSVCESQNDSVVATLPDSRLDEITCATPTGALPNRDLPESLQELKANEVDYGSCSLGLMIERCYGMQEDRPEDEHQPGYKRAFSNWNMFLSSFILDQERQQDFRAKLSQSQTTSARILVEWWNDEIGLETRTQRALRALETASHTGRLDCDAFRLFGISPLAMADERREHYLQRLIFDCSGPPYHTFMFRLFQMEFLPCHYFGAIARKTLICERQRAAKLAACQRVSLCCYRSLLSECDMMSGAKKENVYDGDKTVDVGAGETVIVSNESSSSVQGVRNVFFVEAPGYDAPEDPASGPLHVQKKYLSPEELARLKRTIFPESGLRIGASLSPCEWLEDTDSLGDLPYYLWDIKQRQTVLAGKLTGTVEYTAVSHTWGRYKYCNYEEYPPVQLAGIKEWTIPQNSKFKVDQLPDILASVPFNTPYVWFDLVCIPQEPTDERLIRISKEEIGRQAKIFRRAKFAAAWLNDIDSWKGMNAAIRRLCVHFLQEGNEDGIPQPVLDLAIQDPDSILELFNDTSEKNDAPEHFVNRWFSSLWTLQEVCLRPDMRLCNKSWEALAVGENGKMRIGMDDLIALAEGGHFQANTWETIAEADAAQSGKLTRTETSDSFRVKQINARSRATEQLWELLDLSGMEHLLNVSRSTILTLGNQRYCQKNRAEAIMSAVGVTDWFDTFHNESGDGGALPESSEYPLVFVREAADKIGAEFYASNLAEGELLEMLILSLKPARLRREGVGSMVPFTSSLLSRSPSSSQGFTGLDHPAVSTWKILPDRSVEIRKAGILSYTGQSRSRHRGLTCACVAPESKEPISLLVKACAKVDIDVWVDSFLPSTRNFAICLHHGHGVSDGILLKELSSGELIKVGSYHITKRNAYKSPVPETYNVNWRVL